MSRECREIDWWKYKEKEEKKRDIDEGKNV